MFEAIRTEARRHNVSFSAVINDALEVFFGAKITRSSWETTDAQGWYDPKKFYTYSEDKKGHSAQLRLRVPTNLAGQIARVVNSGIIPELRTSQDFYRDALFHRAHDVAEWIDDGLLKKEVDVMMLRSEQARIRQSREDAIELIGETRENLTAAYHRGDFDWIRAQLDQLYTDANAVPELFREDYLTLLNEFASKDGVQRDKAVTRIGERRRRRVSNGE